MATRNTDNMQSFIAATDLSATDYRFVQMAAADNSVEATMGELANIIGIRQNSPKAGEECAVQIGGKAKLTLAMGVAKGAFLTSAVDGAAKQAVGHRDVVRAIALESGAAGNVIEVLITHFLFFV